MLTPRYTLRECTHIHKTYVIGSTSDRNKKMKPSSTTGHWLRFLFSHYSLFLTSSTKYPSSASQCFPSRLESTLAVSWLVRHAFFRRARPMPNSPVFCNTFMSITSAKPSSSICKTNNRLGFVVMDWIADCNWLRMGRFVCPSLRDRVMTPIECGHGTIRCRSSTGCRCIGITKSSVVFFCSTVVILCKQINLLLSWMKCDDKLVIRSIT